MDIVKLLIVFAIIIVVMWLKKPLLVAVAVATVGTILIYQLPLNAAWAAIGKGATGWSTIEALLVFYAITFLQRMMEKRKNLSNCQVALNGIFNNRRINTSVAPFLLGCLPAASTVLICGPIVRDSVGDYLSTPEKAAVTSYFRHISESFLPTYTTIFIAVGLTNGAVTVSSFVLAMLPMVAALFITGYVVYLRRIPKDTDLIPDKPKSYYWKLLAKSLWAIVLAIVIIMIFKLPVEVAVLICIIINIFANKFSFAELRPFFRTAFEGKLILSTWLVMIFKEVLAATGVIAYPYLPGICPYLFLRFHRGGQSGHHRVGHAHGDGFPQRRTGPGIIHPTHVHELRGHADLSGSHLPNPLCRGLQRAAGLHGYEDHAHGRRLYHPCLRLLFPSVRLRFMT